jgi:cytoskeleton protein RodZ
VFEAELASGRHGPIRGVKGGPNWSVIVAAVMTVVLAWSVARLVMDHPSAVTPSSPSLADGSAGLTSAGQAAVAAPVPVLLTAAGGGAHVVVRDGTGKVVFTGSLAFGQSRTLQVSPPVRIQTTDGSLEVSVDGESRGALGKTGQPAQDVFAGA